MRAATLSAGLLFWATGLALVPLKDDTNSVESLSTADDIDHESLTRQLKETLEKRMEDPALSDRELDEVAALADLDIEILPEPVPPRPPPRRPFRGFGGGRPGPPGRGPPGRGPRV
ncbi:uncharacterized protein DNG_08279 [Cephalotrichum gorgonifer]|uniref:Secreted protein n=1 Tax=Cephalotrichum gorgonifer TaxID=2041049 RepID=A0AAE8N658_9PEZI|nr:uncharacterized protein DNG_08279 [Cephalotrichum gorgonifer]